MLPQIAPVRRLDLDVSFLNQSRRRDYAADEIGIKRLSLWIS